MVSCANCGHLSHIVKYIIFYSINIQYIANVLGVYGAAFLAIVESYFSYDGAVHMQISAPLTKSQRRVSDTRVIVKACQLLFD